MKILFSVLLICFLSHGCSDKEKKDRFVLSEKQMTEVMWDLMRADEYIQDFVIKDSTKNKKEESSKLYEEIFRLHHTTADQFKKSQAWYESDPARFRPIIDSLVRKQNIVNPQMRPPTDTGFEHIKGKPLPKE